MRGRKGDWFVRPLYWEDDLPAVPAELKGLHFARLELGETEDVLALPSLALKEGTQLPAAVVPLAGGAERLYARLRQDLSEAIRFLETTTGLRYYPVPTILVDDYLIRTVRKRTEVDSAFDEERYRRLTAAAEAANGIALQFHGRFYSKKLPRDFAELFGSGVLVEQEQFEALRIWCEAGISGAVGRLMQRGVVEGWHWLQAEHLAPDTPEPTMVIRALVAFAIAELKAMRSTMWVEGDAQGDWAFGAAAEEILADCDVRVQRRGWSRG